VGSRRRAPDRKWGLYLMGGGILCAILFILVLALASSSAALQSVSQPTFTLAEVQESELAVHPTLGVARTTANRSAAAPGAPFLTRSPSSSDDTPALVASSTFPGAGTPAPDSAKEHTTAPTRTPAPGDTPASTRTLTRTAAPQQIKAGTYMVGTQIKPGIYRGISHGGDSCYWQRLANLSGSFEAIITDGYSSGQFYVQVLATDYAFSTDCDMVPLESLPQPSGDFPQAFQQGMYLVGRDIQAGVYRGEGGCYWERLADVTGTLEGILANANPIGQFYLRVKESDFAVAVDCPIVALESIPTSTGNIPLSIEPGMYLVGRDILPGTYSGQGPYCYWERLADVSGASEDVIANDLPQGAFTIQILESDFAFSTECDLKRTGH